MPSSSSSSLSSKSTTTAGVLSITSILAVVTTILVQRHARRRRERSKWVEEEATKTQDEGTLPSIIGHFRGVQLTDNTTIEEANKRRTECYYQKARDAHLYQLVTGVRSYPSLRNKREAELQRIMQYHVEGTKSHRTVIVMCDAHTTHILAQARHEILKPLQYSTDIATHGVWIPLEGLIPERDFHVTVALPWWWHTMRSGNYQLSQELVVRFRQAVVVGFHHPFQIELERIVLLGGQTLVALWRTIGERQTEDGVHIYDRHGEAIDPMARLRHEIVRCFTMTAFGKDPLTYAHYRQSVTGEEVAAAMTPTASKPLYQDKAMTSDNIPALSAAQNVTASLSSLSSQPAPAASTIDTTTTTTSQPTPTTPTTQDRAVAVPSATTEVANESTTPSSPPAIPRRGMLKRSNTIERRTPGMGNNDGFIHTTLARLPLDCLSMTDVELEPIHRLCREATATYCGHRMVISKFRFLETCGAGGDANPCVDPIFDETIEAPVRVDVTPTGGLNHNVNLHIPKNVHRHATIGSVEKVAERMTVQKLFEEAAELIPEDDDDDKVVAVKKLMEQAVENAAVVQELMVQEAAKSAEKAATAALIKEKTAAAAATTSNNKGPNKANMGTIESVKGVAEEKKDSESSHGSLNEQPNEILSIATESPNKIPDQMSPDELLKQELIQGLN